MPLLFQKVIKNDDLRRNPEAYYVFGDNVRRVGLGGQAGEMRGEPNAVGVATKYAVNNYFGSSPEEFLAQKRILDHDMSPLFIHAKIGGIIIWPTDGIGTGLSALPRRAPDTFEYLQGKLAALCRVARLFDKERFIEADHEATPHLSSLRW